MYKKNFPLFYHYDLQQKKMVYLDSASTTQKPQVVIDALMDYYTHYTATPHRTLYRMGEQVSEKYQSVRNKVAQFINAADAKEIIFTKGTTEAINFVASTWAMEYVKEGDEIVITELEHSSNAVPWQIVAQKKNARLIIIPVQEDGVIDQTIISHYITTRTKLVAVTHVSNALGLGNNALPVIVKIARAVGAKILIDGAQAVGYQKVDVQALDADWYVFSGHKMLGPTGVGVLYMKQSLFPFVKPYQYGGGAVVDFLNNHVTLAQAPDCYEAGTPPVAQVLGLGATIDFLQSIGMDTVHTVVNELVKKCVKQLQTLPRIRIVGNVDRIMQEAHLVSFTIEGMHAHDVGAFLDSKGICVRTGVHCAHLIAQKMGYNATVRVSFHVYNDEQDVEYLIACLRELFE